MKTKLKLHLLLLTLLSLSGSAHAQGAAIGYQGRLNDGGLPATGLYDFTFKVFDVEAGGAALAGTVFLAAVPVTNGLFTVTLDFGAGVFTGPARWLEIGVRTNGSVAAYSILSPRQALTPSPYAIFATTSGTASNVVNGSVVKSLNNLRDNVTLAAGSNVTITPSGNTLTISSAGAGGSGIWSVNGNNAYYNAGNVGIGTLAPASKLEIQGTVGAIRLNADLITIGSNDDGYELNLVGGVPDGSSAGGQIRLGGSGRGDGDLNVIQFKQNDSEVMRIGNGGNVGIGTTTPGRLLQLGNSDTRSQGMLRLASRSGTTSYRRSWDIGVPMSDNNLDGSFYSFVIDDRELGTEPEFMVHWGSGDVGIGTVTPRSRLHVNGGIWYDGVLNKLDVGESLYATVRAHDLLLGHPSRHGAPGRALVDFGDSLHLNFASDWANTVIGGANVSVCTLTIRGGCDLAEPFEMKEEELEKGSVVVIDEEHPGRLKRSRSAYDTRVAGIISGANGISPGIALHQEGGQNVALSGRVYVQADAAFGAIKPGDLLTTSDTPGHAMKVSEHGKSQGAILGKAMSGLKEGKGMVLVLATLQ